MKLDDYLDIERSFEEYPYEFRFYWVTFEKFCDLINIRYTKNQRFIWKDLKARLNKILRYLDVNKKIVFLAKFDENSHYIIR